MSVEKRFNPVVTGHDLYEGLVKDGLLISENYKPSGVTKEHLYIIGLFCCYDNSLNYGDYDRFGIIIISDTLINNCYMNMFGKIKPNKSNGNLLYEIMGYNDIERIDVIKNYLGIKNFPVLDKIETEKIIDKTWNKTIK